MIDSGTTNTRARLVRGGNVVRTLSRPAGARDTATDGHNGRLRSAIGELLAQFAAEENDLEEALFSGMITSNVGLLEVPHLEAPAGLDDLARAVVRHDFPELSRLPFRFIRGVRTRPDGAELPEWDVMRGEEVEVVGLRSLLRIDREAVFVHYGSHHKAIDVAADGTILRSRTSITGEMLAALRDHTILRSSVVAMDDLVLDDDAWREGMEAARHHGLGRALFLVRVGEQIGGRTREAMTSFLLGALASVDVPLLRSGGTTPEVVVVLYGRGPLKEILRRYLTDANGAEVLWVDDAVAERAAVVGALTVANRARQLGCLP